MCIFASKNCIPGFKLDLKNTEIPPDFLFVFFDFARDKCTELNPLRIKDSSWAQ
jgi:hypothetical protein